jgi:hypothetical protein
LTGGAIRSPGALALTIVMAACAPADGQGPLVRVEGWRHLFGPGPVDPGAGLVAFGGEAASAADTIPLYRRRGDARPAGYVIRLTDTAAMAQTWALEWPESLATNLLEFGYEIPGLPADSAPGADGWISVLPGFAADGSPARAWTRPADHAAEFVAWNVHLPEHELFFREGVRPEFFAAPEGGRVEFPLPAGGDYVLHPLEARAGWLKVRAVTPSDFCADPEAPATAELWIRYLDRSGRPLVWYHTRGC